MEIFLLYFCSEKIQLLKWHLELFPLIYEFGGTDRTVVLVQYKDFLHCILKKLLIYFFF